MQLLDRSVTPGERSAKARAALRVAPRAVGAFYATSLETYRCMFKRPFHLREFLQQAWFIASVSIMPALLMAIPFCMMFVYQINILLAEIGAVDLAGAARVSRSSGKSAPSSLFWWWPAPVLRRSARIWDREPSARRSTR